MKNKTIVRAVVLITIALLIAGGWLLKNYNEEDRPSSENEAKLPNNPNFELNITTAMDMQTLKSYGLPIIIDFGADSCIPCKEMAPVLKELNETLQGKAIIGFVDVWKFQSLAEGYPISVIPTQIFIGADGKPFTPADPEALDMNKYYYKTSGEHAFTAHEGGLTKSQLQSILEEMGGSNMAGTINNWLEILSKMITANIWLAPLLAFLAGVLTSFTPCSLTSVPLIIGYVGVTVENDTKKALKLSIMFSLGLACTLTALGTLASLLGRLMQSTGSWWYILLGSLMVLMALQVWEIINLVPSSYALGKNKKRGYFGAFVAGILGGLFSSPCATPVLVALLSLVAEEGSLITGIVLLLMYSLGHSILVIIAGTSIGFVQRISKSEKYGTISKVIRIVMGLAILMIGLYMLYLGF